MRFPKQRAVRFCTAVILLAGLLLAGASAVKGEEAAFTVRCDHWITSYGRNSFLLSAPEAGKATIRIEDQHTLYRILTFDAVKGDNCFTWDGAGFNGERLLSKHYWVKTRLETESGRILENVFDTYVQISSQALIFALPSDDEVFLDRKDIWFLEAKTVADGTLVFELLREGNEEPAFIRRKEVSGGKILKLSFSALSGKEDPEPGSYLARIYEKTNPEWKAEFPLWIREAAEESEPVHITGNIMPSRDDPDELIWQKMTETAVVVNRSPTDHQEVFSTRDPASSVLGTLHGQTQALSVLELEDGWAKIGAWNHEEGAYIEGWVPSEMLKTERPGEEYGLLLDKKAQTLTIFRNGKRLDTLLVSTGRMEPGELYQETAAGSFLTGEHRVDFSTNGLKYDHVIQYDGGNLLHQIPYAWGEEKRDFSAGRPYLGTKASHACIRIQAMPGEGGLNAYWIWTHIPYHTRLIILDDPEEREKEKIMVSNTMPEYDSDLLVDSETETEEQQNREDILLTFGGDAVLGGRETYWANPESLMAYLEKNGLNYPFSGLRSLFEQDDITCVNLECVLKSTRDGENTEKTWRFRGLPEYAAMLPASSVELVNTANNHTVDYGPEGMRSTLEALLGKAEACGNETCAVFSIKGQKIGFGGCRETTYLQDPDVIRRDIGRMKNEGCGIVVYQCHWGKEYSEHHNLLQEAMARACVRAGADLVIGHHPHVVQGIDVIDGVPVLYSLGNLMFGGTIRLETYDGLLARICIRPDNGDIVLRLIPILTSGEAENGINDYCPLPAREEDRIRILRKIQQDTPFPVYDTMKIRSR